MLYVSRKYSDHLFAVTDTDDGKVDKVSYHDLYECIIKLGIPIQGVVLKPDGFLDIKVYDKEKIKKAIKGSLKHGLAFEVNSEGKLTKLSLESPSSTFITIRLSDYCTGLDNYSLALDLNLSYSRICFILDNWLTLDEMSLCLSNIDGKSFDFSKLSDNNALIAYASLFETSGMVFCMDTASYFKLVLDDPLRRSAYLAGYLLRMQKYGSSLNIYSKTVIWSKEELLRYLIRFMEMNRERWGRLISSISCTSTGKYLLSVDTTTSRCTDNLCNIVETLYNNLNANIDDDAYKYLVSCLSYCNDVPKWLYNLILGKRKELLSNVSS